MTPSKEEILELLKVRDRHLETASKIVQFAKMYPKSYTTKVEEAPKHMGYESLSVKTIRMLHMAF